MNILTVVGARPQFIKAAVVSRAFRKESKIQESILHTGQHYDANMSDVFFDELDIPRPKFNLEVSGGNHGAMTGRMLEGIEKVLLAEKPDYVLVYGDTNSTLAGALAAAKLHVPVAHVEAGLRSFNKKMPEEINRILTDQVSQKLFVPTEIGRQNLLNEGQKTENIYLVGDVMYDASLFYGAIADRRSEILNNLSLESKSYILATCHRAENTDDPKKLEAIFIGLFSLASQFKIVCPVHPRTQKLIEKAAWYKSIPKNMHIIDPVGYLDMVALEKHALVIATDSGGVQKEAFFFKTPCVTLRGETEWIELVGSGWNRLAEPTESEIVSSAIKNAIGSKGQIINPYGNGDAGDRIVQELIA